MRFKSRLVHRKAVATHVRIFFGTTRAAGWGNRCEESCKWKEEDCEETKSYQRELSSERYIAEGTRTILGRALTGSVIRKKCISFGSMPDKVHCAHILVKTESEVKKILERLGKGEKFANIAKEVSLCPSGKRGGDLGTFGRGQMVKEFETAAFALQKGQISAIVKTKYGYHIIKRLE